jgi:hypothetical protein
MASKITVTGTLGPAKTVTAKIFNDVTAIEFMIARGILRVYYAIPTVVFVDFDLSLVATVTYTIATGNATVTVSS